MGYNKNDLLMFRFMKERFKRGGKSENHHNGLIDM